MHGDNFGRCGVKAISSTNDTNMAVDFTNSFWDSHKQKEYNFDKGDPITVKSLQTFETDLIIDKDGIFSEKKLTKLKEIHYININYSTMYLISDIADAFSLDYNMMIRKLLPNYVQVKMSPFEEYKFYVSSENLYSIICDFNNDSFVKFVQYINHIMDEDVFNVEKRTINLSMLGM